MQTYILVEKDRVPAEPLNDHLARLMAIPGSDRAEIFDVVRYDPESVQESGAARSYRLVEVVDPSRYRSYLAWGRIHRSKALEGWLDRMAEAGIIVEMGESVTGNVRQLRIALPPESSALQGWALVNRHLSEVEIVSPLLAAHADDLDRSKSDLERAIAWGGSEPELTFAVAEAFEEKNQWDEAVTFWERLAHMLPDSGPAREHLAVSYARLGVYHLAATEFDRAADLSNDPEHREQLRSARDLMWEQSKV